MGKYTDFLGSIILFDQLIDTENYGTLSETQ